MLKYLLLISTLVLAVNATTKDPRYHRDTDRRALAAQNTTEYAKRFFESRRKLEEAVREPEQHKKAWHTYESVDGLKNTEVAVFITSTDSGNEHYLWERIIPSARTWMKYLANAFVIVEDNFMMRYALRQCRVNEYTHYTTFDCHNEPTYILSRKCTSEYYGWAGPCCKVDDMINYLTNDRPDFFAKIKYILHGDDDTYFRVDQVMKWLAAVDKAGLDDLPLTANSNPTNKHYGIWHIDGCKEIQGVGWFQPLMLNHAALKRLSYSSSVYGFSETCKHFVVTHDVGFEAHAWIMELNHIIMPKTEINGGHKGIEIFRPDIMVMHNVRHDDDDKCRDENQQKQWPENLRFNQKVVIGCGDIDTPGPFHSSKHVADMYDAFNYFRKEGVPLNFVAGEHEFYEANVILQSASDPKNLNSHGVLKIKEILEDDAVAKIDSEGKYEGQQVVKRVIPRVMPIRGHEKTAHGKKYDLTKEWKAFTVQDCTPPGRVT